MCVWKFFFHKLNERKLNTYNGCIGKEYVITDKDQILPSLVLQ